MWLFTTVLALTMGAPVGGESLPEALTSAFAQIVRMEAPRSHTAIQEVYLDVAGLRKEPAIPLKGEEWRQIVTGLGSLSGLRARDMGELCEVRKAPDNGDCVVALPQAELRLNIVGKTLRDAELQIDVSTAWSFVRRITRPGSPDTSTTVAEISWFRITLDLVGGQWTLKSVVKRDPLAAMLDRAQRLKNPPER